MKKMAGNSRCRRGLAVAAAILAVATLSVLLAHPFVSVPSDAFSPVSVPAGEPAGAVEWSLSSDGTLSITGSGPMDDYPDASSVPWAEQAQSVTKVSVGSGVKRIGDHAFHGCTNLVSAEIPDTVDSIGAYSFTDCISLAYVSLPDSVIAIPDHAFHGCSALTTVSLSSDLESIGPDAFTGTSIRFLMIPYGCEYVSEGDGRSFDEEASIIHMHRTVDSDLAIITAVVVISVSTLVCAIQVIIYRRSRGEGAEE